jgi:hypothetical protein
MRGEQMKASEKENAFAGINNPKGKSRNRDLDVTSPIRIRSGRDGFPS